MVDRSRGSREIERVEVSLKALRLDYHALKSPPAPLACLCGRKKIAKEGFFPPFVLIFLSPDRQREVRRDFIK
jgi:hypothetical protein